MSNPTRDLFIQRPTWHRFRTRHIFFKYVKPPKYEICNWLTFDMRKGWSWTWKQRDISVVPLIFFRIYHHCCTHDQKGEPDRVDEQNSNKRKCHRTDAWNDLRDSLFVVTINCASGLCLARYVQIVKKKFHTKNLLFSRRDNTVLAQQYLDITDTLC